MKIEKSFLLVLLLSIILFCGRMIPHSANFSPVLALFLMAGFLGKNRWYSFLLPLLALTLSDFYLGTYPGWAFTYIPMILIVVLGSNMKKESLSFLSFGFMSASLFFLVSNLGVWFYSGLYTLDFQGLLRCYQLALPFFRASLVSTLSFVAVSYMLVQSYSKLVDRESVKSTL